MKYLALTLFFIFYSFCAFADDPPAKSESFIRFGYGFDFSYDFVPYVEARTGFMDSVEFRVKIGTNLFNSASQSGEIYRTFYFQKGDIDGRDSMPWAPVYVSHKYGVFFAVSHDETEVFTSAIVVQTGIEFGGQTRSKEIFGRFGGAYGRYIDVSNSAADEIYYSGYWIFGLGVRY